MLMGVLLFLNQWCQKFLGVRNLMVRGIPLACDCKVDFMPCVVSELFADKSWEA
ncbi:hypothetical protein SAMN05720758_1438 [Fibrobacter sp. UWB11]|nr:hypothetical protein SAMN05720758_1438 [Fibrobacter sp. UWB11]